MRIITCIKQVPDTCKLKFDPETNDMVRSGSNILNPFDQFAVEESIAIRNMLGTGKVTSISMGPPEAVNALKECLAFGVNDAILLTDPAFRGADTWATSHTLALAIKKIGKFDLILCGQQSTDGDTGQVGPELAQQLGIPQVTYVVKLVIGKDGVCEVTRQMENGCSVLKVMPPVLLTLVPHSDYKIKSPRMKGILEAHENKIEIWDHAKLGGNASQLGRKGSFTKVVKSFEPTSREKCILLDGKPEDAVNKLVMHLENSIKR